MKKKITRLTSFLLAVTMSFTLLSASAWAKEIFAEETTMVGMQTNKSVTSSGTCGDNLTWSLDDNGTLTISGTGPMDNYTEEAGGNHTMPWYSVCTSIKMW